MWILLQSCLSIWLAAPCQADEHRVALVVGVSNYAHAPALAHTLDDARDMSGALKRLGFEVDLVLDPDRAALEAAVRRLGQKSRGADASLFYYSGHAIESQGINWIIPASADVMSERDLRFEALDLGAVLEQTQGAARVSLLFLDACRDDPFKQRLTSTRDLTRGGLANLSAAVGTYVAFATAPGMVADDGTGPHSPFTDAVLKFIETPGMEIRQLLSSVRREVRETTGSKQVPWDSSALEGDFYFSQRPPDPAPPITTRPLETPSSRSDRADSVFWESVRESKNVADIKAYLARFPRGIFAELARNRLKELEPSSQTAAAPNPKLLAALAISAPTSSPKGRDDFVNAYQGGDEHKAVAANAASGAMWRVATRATEQEAEEDALEACEVFSGAACALVAVDDEVQEGKESKDFLSREMPRVQYVGPFDPARIPTIQRGVRERKDVISYSSAPSPKAAAYHPTGRLFIVTGAAAQRAAEEQALAVCNGDPIRNGQSGACYLYASNNEVVLSRHSKNPITPAATAAIVVPDPRVLDALAIAAPSASEKVREDFASAYQAALEHKAAAANAASGAMWRVATRATQQEAEENALEACEVYSGAACALVVVDDKVQEGKRGSDFPPHGMPRVHYAGPFDPARIPFVRGGLQGRNDVTSYVSAPAPKAAAYHPVGNIFIVIGASTQRAAEEQALSVCNDDPVRNGANGPCYLYASNNDVVLTRHSRAPITPAATASAAGLSFKTIGATASAAGPSPPATAMATASPPVPLKDAVHARLAAIAPTAAIESAVESYLALNDRHKAIAAASAAPYTIAFVAGLPSPPDAVLIALERCQLLQRAPCTLVAVDNALPQAPTDGKWPVIDSPRVSSEEPFSPILIPGLAPADRTRADVAGYIVAPAPKAVALTAGKITIVSGAQSQLEAEQAALTTCGAGCYLYAVSNKVVLSQYLTKPRPLGKSLGDVLSYALADSAGSKLASNFEQAKSHKSMAMIPESGRSFTFQGAPSAEAAQNIALEACELLHNVACVTVATDGKVLAPDPFSSPRHMMPRVTYEGPYRPEMVPLFDAPTKEIREYKSLNEPKAMAIRAAGPKLKIETGHTLAEAEAKALALCNDESPYPCILYAANERVILQQRHTEPEP
jgi:hypothetical protein